jgi:hypothetical protein
MTRAGAARLALVLVACTRPAAETTPTAATDPAAREAEPAATDDPDRPAIVDDPSAPSSADDDLRDARMLDTVAARIRDPADARIAWLAAAAAWDRVVARGALPRFRLRDAAVQAIIAIRLARAPDEAPPGPLPPRVAREIAALDRHVALLDQPDGADGLGEQLDAAQLAVTWGARDDAIRRLEHIVDARRRTDLTPIAVDLLLASLRDPAAIRARVDRVLGDAAYVRRFPDSAVRVRLAGARLDLDAALALLGRGDFPGCAAAFERLAQRLPAGMTGADVARFDQAVCLERAGRRDDAIAIYRDVVARFASSALAATARRRLTELNAPAAP